MHSFQSFILRRVATLTGHVDEQHDIALVARQVNVLAVQGLHLEIERGRHFLVSFLVGVDRRQEGADHHRCD